MQQIVFMALIMALIGGGYGWYQWRKHYSDDSAIWMALVKINGRNALECAPKNLIDRELRLKAVKRFGYALKYVPENLRDLEMCLAAVKDYNSYLEFVPEKLKSQVKAGKKH